MLERSTALAALLAGSLSSVLEWILSRRGLAVGFCLSFLLAAQIGWLRPPLSPDVSGFELSIWPGETRPETLASNLLSSSGILTCAALTMALVALLWPSRVQLAVGVMLVTLVATEAAATLNHPARIDALAHESTLQSLLAAMLHEPLVSGLDINLYPRVAKRSTWSSQPLLEARQYCPAERTLFYVAACFGVLLAAAGSLPHRLLQLTTWTVVGVAVAGIVCWPRFEAEWRYALAARAEAAGRLLEASAQLGAAGNAFPEFRSLDRVALLAGKIDYDLGIQSPYGSYFRAVQAAKNDRPQEAIDWLERAAASPDSPLCISRKLTALLTQRVVQRFQHGDFDAAYDAVAKALQHDPQAGHLQLVLAVTRCRATTGDANTMATLLKPQLPMLADRAIRAGLLSMLGDCYFEEGEFRLARECYAQSIEAYSLPKQINYRALRGLLGM